MNFCTTLTDSITLLATRRLAASLCLASTVALVACGGGSAGTAGSRLNDNEPQPDSSSSSSQSADQSSSSSSSSSASAEPEEPNEEPVDNNDDDGDSGTGGSDNPDSGSDNPDDGGDDSAGNGDDDVIEDVLVEVNGSVLLEWREPEVRENGDPIYEYELGGYEVRYRKDGEDQFTSEVIADWSIQETEFHDLDGTYEFEIAAYDNNGLYSEFVNILPAQ